MNNIITTLCIVWLISVDTFVGRKRRKGGGGGGGGGGHHDGDGGKKKMMMMAMMCMKMKFMMVWTLNYVLNALVNCKLENNNDHI